MFTHDASYVYILIEVPFVKKVLRYLKEFNVKEKVVDEIYLEVFFFPTYFES